MKKAVFSSFVVLLITSAAVSAAAKSSGDSYVSDEIIVKFRRPLADTIQAQTGKDVSSGSLNLPQDIEQLNTKYKVKRIEPLFKNFRQKNRQFRMLQQKSGALPAQRENHILQRLKRVPKGTSVPELDRIYKVQVDLEQGQSLQDVVEAYRHNPDVEYAELNYIVSLNLIPDDPLYSLQWSLSKIDSAGAWEMSVGSGDVIVAVVDTGVDYTHRDLDDNMWVNEAELNGAAGIDDDGNGYIDDIYGYDFFNRDPDPKDDHGHGTHCAGIIAAEGNNGSDITGMCWDGSVMALKFLSAAGWGKTDDAVEAFYYAVENGADVLSNSWGGDEFSDALRDVINYAHSQGVIVVAAAGNEHSEMLQYPAAYDNVVAVAATDSADQKAGFSSYGNWVDIAAPGVDILSLRAGGTSMGTIHDDYTTTASGTSMACPHVAGACAFLLSINPTLGSDDVYEILMKTADPILPGICISGRLNLFNATAITQGSVSLDRDYYSCLDSACIRLLDCGLQGQGTQEVTVTADGGDLETVVLIETVPVLGIFAGSIPIDSGEVNAGDGILQVSDGQIITLTYHDIRDAGGNAADITDTATVDCERLAILNVRTDPTGPEPAVYFDTDEPATARVLCGLACGGPYIIEANDANLTVSHTIKLRGVSPETDYFFTIEAVDAAGNETVSDNLGRCYTFTTNRPCDVYVPTQYPTIQGGIDHCWDGGTVVVADGIYIGAGNYDIDFGGKAIVVRGENGPQKCIIDCQNKGRGFLFYRGEDQNSVVDGFTIKNGYPTVNFNPAVPQDLQRGAGIYCLNSSFTITNCRFVENIAQGVGGGIYCDNGNIKVSNCTFECNRALTGAGISCQGSLVLTDCRIIENTAEDGAGIEIFGDLMMRGCSVTDNRATGVFMQRNVLFIDGYGGGVRCYTGITDISDCIISRNSGNFGGGLFYWNSDASISNCVITDNSAIAGGGIGDNAAVGGVSYYYETSASSVITNCTISNNKAFFDRRRYSGGIGGGIVTGWQTTTRTTISNCILRGNVADEGEQVYIADSTYLVDPNDPNSPDPMDVMNRMNIFYSNIEGGLSGVFDTNSILTWGPGNVDSVPRFAFADDYHLLGGSACIDAGTNEPNGGLPTTDLDGISRPLDGDRDAVAVADMGAYEFNSRLPSVAVSPSPVRFFCEEGSLSVNNQILSIRNCGGGILSWHIREDCPWLRVSKTRGISRDKADKVILSADSSSLSAGDYECELVVYDSRAPNSPRIIPVRLHVRGNLRVPSGYPTIEAAINAARNGDVVLVEDGVHTGLGNRDISFYGKAITVKGENGPQNCIIDCQGTETDPHRGFVFLDGEGADSIVDGLTVTGGFINLDWFKIFPPFDGGSIYCYGSNPTIRNCIIRDNKASGWGGGLFIFWTENTQGVSNIENCRLVGNYASSYGGGMWTDNYAAISNCVIEQNKAGIGGGGLCCEYSCQAITNCTVVGNSANDYGGGIYAPWWWDDPNYLFVTNSIITDNTARSGPQIASKDAKLSISHSLLRGGANDVYRDPCDILVWGQGNVDTDPCFVQAGYWDPNGLWTGGDYHLLPTSPCVDAGADAGVYTDIEGNIRPFNFPGIDNNGRLPDFDMGAYEVTIHTEADLFIFPRVINRQDPASRIAALVHLPQGVTEEQIDNSRPLLLYPGGIEACHQHIVLGGRGSNWRTSIIAFFDKADLMAAVPENGGVDLQVVGRLKNGQYFYGCDTVRIIDNRQYRQPSRPSH